MSSQKKKVGTWKTLSSKLVYENPWTKVFHEEVIRPNGEKGIYGVLEQTDGVYVVPLGSRGEIFMIYLENFPIAYTHGKFLREDAMTRIRSPLQNVNSRKKRDLKQKSGHQSGNFSLIEDLSATGAMYL